MVLVLPRSLVKDDKYHTYAPLVAGSSQHLINHSQAVCACATDVSKCVLFSFFFYFLIPLYALSRDYTTFHCHCPKRIIVET